MLLGGAGSTHNGRRMPLRRTSRPKGSHDAQGVEALKWFQEPMFTPSLDERGGATCFDTHEEQ